MNGRRHRWPGGADGSRSVADPSVKIRQAPIGTANALVRAPAARIRVTDCYGSPDSPHISRRCRRHERFMRGSGGAKYELAYTVVSGGLLAQKPSSAASSVTRAIQGWLEHPSITSTAAYTALAPNRFKDFWRDCSSGHAAVLRPYMCRMAPGGRGGQTRMNSSGGVPSGVVWLKFHQWNYGGPPMSDPEITVVQFNRPCPVCDGFMELSSIDSEPWSPRTMGERLRFCCRSCGMTQSEWSAISLDAPSTAPA
jgi:hypothetical protein